MTRFGLITANLREHKARIATCSGAIALAAMVTVITISTAERSAHPPLKTAVLISPRWPGMLPFRYVGQLRAAFPDAGTIAYGRLYPSAEDRVFLAVAG